ncbi:MAG: AAA family ATPase [Fimbriimonadaceae bacterium]|nr:AAA family ATPase [Fimbriimonadaceae bacterium]
MNPCHDSISMSIYFITGPPGSGKSTLCAALAETFEFGVHLPVDDLRLWVSSGLSEPVPWSEETERQFRIAESAACDVAKRYADGGFVVTVDHCRNPQRLQELIELELPGRDVRQILLLPSLEENLRRNRERTNKSFDPTILDETIRFTNDAYRVGVPPDWLVIDNTDLTLGATLELVLGYRATSSPDGS